MVYAVYGLVFGLFIPYISRRFAKFMPATPAYGLYRLFMPVKNVSSERWKKSLIYSKLRREYFYRSMMSAVITAALSYLAYDTFGTIHLGWALTFIWLLILLAEIDYRTFLLPDILTVPLLICGFSAAAMGWGFVSASESALGAAAGYILPTVAGLLFVWRHQDAFGGGDIKLLAAIGAWVGAEALFYVIILSAILFGMAAFVRKKRAGAYGPSAAAAAIIIAFYFF